MEDIRLLIVFGFALFMQACGQNKEQNRAMPLNEYEAHAVKRSNFRSYEIGKDEVRDTSFTLPRKLLDDPMAFMEALTDVQMINRIWTDEYNYTEKLQFGDSIWKQSWMKLRRYGGRSKVYCGSRRGNKGKQNEI